MSRKKKNKSSGILDSILGFTPGESVITWILENYADKVLSYKEVERLLILDVRPNYYAGIMLSAFDLCGVKIGPEKPIELPEVSMNNYTGSSSRSNGSFVDEYIREICIFPTLNREQELELAKLMEIAYIRYKNSICYCPAVLDYLDKQFREVKDTPTLGYDFNLPHLKSLIVPGSSDLSYEQLWKLVSHQWEKIMELRMRIKELGMGVYSSDEVSRDDEIALMNYKFAVGFLLKDLNIKESIFHAMRNHLPEVEAEYPHLKADFKRVRTCYERYIECKNLMVNYNLKLVVSIARKFFSPKVSPMDVIQYGNEGLIRAAEDYNYKLKFKFSTYAIWWIRQKIQEGIQEQEHVIRIPAYRLHLSRKCNAIKERLTRESGVVVTDEVLAGELDLSVDQVKKLRNDPSTIVMSTQSSEEEGTNMLEQLVDADVGEKEKTFDEDATAALQGHLKLYPARERFILMLRYGLNCEEMVPLKNSYEDLEIRFNQTEEDVPDKELNESLPLVLFQFSGLPAEKKVPQEQLKIIKQNKKLDLDLAKGAIPFTDEELEDIRQNAMKGIELDAKSKTILAMVDGVDFGEYISFKSRDRIVLNKIWLESLLKPSVVRKVLNHQGLILDDVAKIFGLTKERVRQIEAKVIRNISYHLVLP
ncbi:MAG: sigma-70 family RNA polymerase sigma factor [Planctomycetes bacterium]|nr:sigma-70 family RNA polymerase sigma factor [Planctomycetota bacterium]